MNLALSIAFFILAMHLYDASWNYLRDDIPFSAVFNFVWGTVAAILGFWLL